MVRIGNLFSFSMFALLGLCNSSSALECGEYASLNQDIAGTLPNVKWKPLPDKRSLNLGYSSSFLLVRFNKQCIAQKTENGSKPVVSIRYPLSTIRIFKYEASKITLLKTLGEKERSKEGYPKSRTHYFELPSTFSGEGLVISASSDTSLQLPITFNSVESVITNRETDAWILATQYGLLAMLALVSSIVGILFKDTFYLSLASLTCGLAVSLATMNWIPQTFIQNIPYFLRLNLVPIGASTLLFGISAFSILSQRRLNSLCRFTKAYKMLLFFGCVIIALALLAPYRVTILAVHISVLLALSILVVDLIVASLSKTKPDSLMVYVIPLPALLGIFTISLKALGLLPSHELVNYLPQIGVIISAAMIFVLTVTILIQATNANAVKESKALWNEALADQAKQVAHDIRSPLATLSLISNGISNMPEETKALLQDASLRISDIANDLLNRNRVDHLKAIETDYFQIAPILKTVIGEKTVQLKAKANTTIQLIEPSGFEYLFCKVNRSAIQRVFCNILQNAIESIPNGKPGYIEVSVAIDDRYTTTTISDNGCGIDELTLERLFEKGATFKKTNGNGLGLAHAKETVERFGGRVSLSSKKDIGTTVKIEFPVPPVELRPPAQISLSNIENVVILDDEEVTHIAWGTKLSNSGVSITNLYSEASLRHYIERIGTNRSGKLFLCDFDIGTNGTSGLDLICEYGIAKLSFLVTNRFDDSNILKKCVENGVRIIPKPLIEKVVALTGRSPLLSDPILIDDDILIRKLWAMSAKAQGKTVHTYPNMDVVPLDNFSLSTAIFIDLSLSNGASGVETALKLKDRGFTNLHLATGYSEPKNIPAGLFVSIQGKSPPWESSTG